MRQPQVQFVVGGQRLEQFDVRAGQPGVSEQRQPRRHVSWAFAQPGHGLFMPGVRGIGGDGGNQRPPKRRLPVQVGTEIGPGT